MDGSNELHGSNGSNGLPGSNGSLSRSTSVPGSNQDNAIQTTNHNESQVPIETGIPLDPESPLSLQATTTVRSFVYKRSLSTSSPEFGTLVCDSISNTNNAGFPGLTMNVYGGTVNQNISYGGAVFSTNSTTVPGTTTSFPKTKEEEISVLKKIRETHQNSNQNLVRAMDQAIVALTEPKVPESVPESNPKSAVPEPVAKKVATVSSQTGNVTVNNTIQAQEGVTLKINTGSGGVEKDKGSIGKQVWTCTKSIFKCGKCCVFCF